MALFFEKKPFCKDSLTQKILTKTESTQKILYSGASITSRIKLIILNLKIQNGELY